MLRNLFIILLTASSGIGVILFVRSCSDNTGPVRITTDQVGVLRTAANSLSERANATKLELARLENQVPYERVRESLHLSLLESRRDVRRTQTAFEKYALNKRAREASQSFFGYLATQYSGVEESLIAVEPSEFPSRRDRAFELLDYTSRAYSRVAEARLLTFDLLVTSVPPGATISYKRKGDDYHTYGSPTTATLKNLDYAMWYVRVQLDGYVEEEKEHDPFKDPNHVLQFTLKPK